MREEVYRDRDFVANYEGRTRPGKRFVSSTYFIKDGEQLLGLVCVNHDVSDLIAISGHFRSQMTAFSVPGQVPTQVPYTEELDDSIPELSISLIHNTVLRQGVPAGRMTPEEKESLIQTLDRQGGFSTKGAVSQVARELDISEPTVYRYLRRIRTR